MPAIKMKTVGIRSSSILLREEVVVGGSVVVVVVRGQAPKQFTFRVCEQGGRNQGLA